MAVGALLRRRPLTDLVFRSAWMTSHPPHRTQRELVEVLV